MPHRRPSLLAARRLGGALVLSVACGACGQPASVNVLIDGSATTDSLEVIALPVDPAGLALRMAHGDAPPSGSPRADSIARLVALRDSLARESERFRAEREALNSEARRLVGLDRRSAEYARRYDAHRAQLVAAERTRATRDRLRSRASALATRLGDAAPPDDSTRRARHRQGMRDAIEAADDGRRESVIVAAPRGAAALALDPGAWWIGVVARGGLPRSYARIDVAAGARDTVRISAR